MKAQVKAAVITGVCTVAAAVIAGVFAWNVGKEQGSKTTLNEIGTAMANVTGDYNQITVNDAEQIAGLYDTLKTKNEDLEGTNTELSKQVKENLSYTEELRTQLEEKKMQVSEFEEQMEALKAQLNDNPAIDFRDVTLTIDGNDIPIDSSKSLLTIDGRDYVSKEIAEKLLKDDRAITVKDKSIFVGRVIAESANLFDQWVVNEERCGYWDGVKDSFGNSRPNSKVFQYNGGYVIYNLNKKYSLLRFTVSVSENCVIDSIITLTVQADDKLVYTKDFNKKTEPFVEIDIPIDNCSLLTIQTTSTSSCNHCILSEASVYN